MATDDEAQDDPVSGPNDEPPAEGTRKAPSEDVPEWLVDWSEPDAQPFQFRLIGLFGIMTACAVYVFLEKMHGGLFGVHLLWGVALFLVVVLPAFWFSAWFVRVVIDRGVSLPIVVLAVPMAGVVVYCLIKYFFG